MRKLIGLSVWWFFLVVATLIVETVFGGVPLWVMILIAVALGAVAIPLMFGREIKEWRSRKSPPGSPHELPEDKDLILDDRGADAEITSDGKEVLVDEVKTAADIEGAGKPCERRLRVASQNPGAGIHIAKLLGEAETRSEAEELLDIFNDAEIQRNKGAVYAAYAGALVRFGDLIDAGGMLISADRVEGLSQEELEAAMARFFYPKDDGETVEDLVDRLRKEGAEQ